MEIATKVGKISVIISVYKNTDSLKVVLESLANQTVKADEIIISEDGDSIEMKTFVESLSYDNIVHFSQKDEGWRKAVALNNSIKNATGDYLIFIDGDVVPHKRFIEGHLYSARDKRVCCGKKAELGEKTTKDVYDGKKTIDKIASSYIRKAISLHKEGVRHYEDGIYVSPKNPINKLYSEKKVVRYIIGCNFSCFKKDMEAINGFDEDYKLPAVGEDIDLGWRFIGMGIELKSCRNIANVYHLWHKKNFGSESGVVNDKILEKNFAVNRFVCLNGLKKLTDNKG